MTAKQLWAPSCPIVLRARATTALYSSTRSHGERLTEMPER